MGPMLDERDAQTTLHYDAPNPELSELVQDSMLSIDVLLSQYAVAVLTIDGALQWMTALQKWRFGLFLTAGYMAAGGYDVPWDLELERAPSHFISTWRDLLGKVWPSVDPNRADRLHRVQ